VYAYGRACRVIHVGWGIGREVGAGVEVSPEQKAVQSAKREKRMRGF
jgi:cobalamin biosynthesis protein CbiD